VSSFVCFVLALSCFCGCPVVSWFVVVLSFVSCDNVLLCLLLLCCLVFSHPCRMWILVVVELLSIGSTKYVFPFAAVFVRSSCAARL
jgi:hypothetical protein